MLYFILVSALSLLFILDLRTFASDVYPIVNGSFFATGESVTVDSETGQIVQITYEETYDKKESYAAVEFEFIGVTFRIYEDIALDQTFIYTDEKRNPDKCKIVTKEDWTSIGLEPHIKQFQLENGHIVTPLRQLISLGKKGLYDKHSEITYRNVPAESWHFKTNNSEIDAYWSIGEWASTSESKTIPLGFKITRTVAGKKTYSHINIMEFQHNIVDQRLLQPKRGIYCPDRVARESVYTFPNSTAELQLLSFNTEFIFEEEKQITSVDTWIDFQYKFMRTDYDPYGRDTNYHTYTKIASGNQGISYEISKQLNAECLVAPLSKDDKVKDIQFIFDYGNISKWNGQSFFGIDMTKYVYVGETEEIGIPCRIFHGMRDDFPFGTTGFKTLWEWCLDISITERAFPAISLTIYFKEINTNFTEVMSPRIKKDTKLTYHFYNIQHHVIPTTFHKFIFDIGMCFAFTHRTDSELQIPVNNDDRDNLRDVVNDIYYVYKWFNKVVDCSQSKQSSLRINNFRLLLTEKGPLVALFTILGRHPDLPDEFTTELTMEMIFENIQTCVNDKTLKVTQNVKEKDVTLTAEKLTNRKIDFKLYTPSHSEMNNMTEEDVINAMKVEEIKYQTNLMKAAAKPVNSNSDSQSSLTIFVLLGGVMLYAGIGIGLGGMFLKRMYNIPKS